MRAQNATRESMQMVPSCQCAAQPGGATHAGLSSNSVHAQSWLSITRLVGDKGPSSDCRMSLDSELTRRSVSTSELRKR